MQQEMLPQHDAHNHITDASDFAGFEEDADKLQYDHDDDEEYYYYTEDL